MDWGAEDINLCLSKGPAAISAISHCWTRGFSSSSGMSSALEELVILTADRGKHRQAVMLRHILCPGFGWDKVNSLLSSWYSAVFWI